MTRHLAAPNRPVLHCEASQQPATVCMHDYSRFEPDNLHHNLSSTGPIRGFPGNLRMAHEHDTRRRQIVCLYVCKPSQQSAITKIHASNRTTFHHNPFAPESIRGSLARDGRQFKDDRLLFVNHRYQDAMYLDSCLSLLMTTARLFTT